MRRIDSAIMLIAMLAFAFFGFDCQRWGVIEGCAIINHMTFNFVHANIFHLVCNAYCMMIMIWSGVGKWRWLLAVLIASLVSFIVPCHSLTVGFSGVLFVVVGMTLAHGKLTWNRCLPVIISLAVSILLAKNIAAGIHIMSCIVGFMVGLFIEGYNELKNDYERLR